ncbi:SGNH/GDSL hydrolase family protein [Paraburkholderia lycopersici]|uniref:Phospholipase/lecithinase/hemolysin n=1 Tax=Paraburkholderia lycopersici TaxID=416944 RepID=A0A1G6KIC7_9BURK|nr:SGNH/GDSL hydrolase family protein [Paraburkholderia lycopersici]SDC30578.1 Phospholipase/lecithinase/hemolysin [Paraburkholderia lycopersici]
MKHQGPRHRTLLRATQIAVASAAFALLAACGGGSGNNNASTPPPSGVNMQVVAFGTSLTDAGTYSEQILPGFGGGRFTTNPGEVWAQKVSGYFGNTLSPAFEGGFGVPLTATGGLDYAQGGAMVFTGGVSNTSAAIPAASEQPITWQIQQYMAQHGSFNANQLVLVEGGANEILALLDNNGAGLNAFGTALATAGFTAAVNNPANQATAISTLTQLGFTQAQAAALVPAAIALNIVQSDPNASTDFASVTPIIAAAVELGTLVNNNIVGAPKVAVVTVPDIGKTPAALKADQVGGTTPGSANSADQALSLVSAMYNLTLLKQLAPNVAAKKVVVVDTFSWLDQSVANAASLGFTVTNTDTACNIQQMQTDATNYALANPQATLGLPPTTDPTILQAAATVYGGNFGSSLFCSPQTLKAANAPTTYMFADLVHPATALHAQFATFVETQLAAAGIGKAPQ